MKFLVLWINIAISVGTSSITKQDVKSASKASWPSRNEWSNNKISKAQNRIEPIHIGDDLFDDRRLSKNEEEISKEIASKDSAQRERSKEEKDSKETITSKEERKSKENHKSKEEISKNKEKDGNKSKEENKSKEGKNSSKEKKSNEDKGQSKEDKESSKEKNSKENSGKFDVVQTHFSNSCVFLGIAILICVTWHKISMLMKVCKRNCYCGEQMMKIEQSH